MSSNTQENVDILKEELFKIQETIDILKEELSRSKEEVVRLRKVIATPKTKQMIFQYRFPELKAVDMLQPEKVEEVRNAFGSVILGMIRETIVELETSNMKVYSVFDINPKEQEVTLAFTGLPSN